MPKVTVYGASDDLIEVDGDIYEEFNYSTRDQEDGYLELLAFSDGTLLSVVYDKHGCWRFNRLATGSATYVKEDAKGPDTPEYSDRVTLDGDLRWVVHGRDYAPKPKARR